VPRHVNPEVAHQKARVAGLTKVGADPERINEARAALKAAGLEARIKRDVASWPPLSAEDRADLAVLLLHPGGDGDAT
jgi:predicted O-methyltransferase YrrM